MVFVKYLTVKLYDVTCDNPVLVYDVDAADNVVTNDAPRYTLICAVASVFVHDNCTDVEPGVALSEVTGGPGPSTTVTVIGRPRPNPLAEPPPNVVKNGDIAYGLRKLRLCGKYIKRCVCGFNQCITVNIRARATPRG